MADQIPAPKKTFNENPSLTKQEADARKKALMYTLTHMLESSNPKPKGTQAGHVVTNSTNHTKPIASKEPARPAVGADVAAKKKYGAASHNNGYTN